jgi:hypothetical protein
MLIAMSSSLSYLGPQVVVLSNSALVYLYVGRMHIQLDSLGSTWPNDLFSSPITRVRVGVALVFTYQGHIAEARKVVRARWCLLDVCLIQ